MSLMFLKVWDITRQKKAMVYANENEDDLLEKIILKASVKLDMNGSKLVLEKDGTPIDEDIILKHFRDEIMILLDSAGHWQEDACLSNVTNSSGLSISAKENEYLTDSSSEILLITNNTSLPSNVDSNENINPNLGNVINYNINCNSQFMWQLFQIPWEQFPEPMIQSCERGERDRNVINYIVHTVVNKMRAIKPIIPSSAIKLVTKKIIDKYPETFRDIDEDNVVIGDGSYSVFKKIQDRNNYLNRPHKNNSKKNGNPVFNKKQKVAEKAGCSHWDPPVKESDVSNEVQITETDENLIEKLENGFPSQRLFLNGNPSHECIKKEWPILLTKTGALFHFNKLTSSDMSNFEEAVEEKFKKILKLNDKEEIDGTDGSKLMKILHIITKYFKEDISCFYMELENLPDTPNDLMQLHPQIIKAGRNYHVFYEKTEIKDSFTTFSDAFMVGFALYFNFNLKYPNTMSLTMEFIQRYFLKIHPDSGSKSKKTGSKRVITLLNKLRNL